MKFNQRYFLCWRDIKCSHCTIRAGRNEICNMEHDAFFDREAMANRHCETMNDIYGQGTHWIEVE